MRINFWSKTWKESNIGFHNPDVHAALGAYWPDLPAPARVLVPLCGKSLDLLWLEERGLAVTGVEFVAAAAHDFFTENDLGWEEESHYGHRCLRAVGRNISIYVTDFMRFAADYTGRPYESLYDRAALVALPRDMRPAYVEACRKLLNPDPRGLLVSLHYEPECMEGPPFSVTESEVTRLWRGQLAVAERVDRLDAMPRAVAAGVQALQEIYWVFE